MIHSSHIQPLDKPASFLAAVPKLLPPLIIPAPLLILRSNPKNPISVFAWTGPEDDPDIIQEALDFFKANVFFNTFEFKGPADNLLVYLTLFTHQCIVRLSKVCDSEG